MNIHPPNYRFRSVPAKESVLTDFHSVQVSKHVDLCDCINAFLEMCVVKKKECH